MAEAAPSAVRRFRIAVDFDGTIVDHRYPEIGPFAPDALRWLTEWSADPFVELMLWTARCDAPMCGPMLSMAARHCMGYGIRFGVVNNKLDDRNWTTNPKLYANVYIDDAAAGTPLIQPAGFKLPCVDWHKVGPEVQGRIDTWKRDVYRQETVGSERTGLTGCTG